jgi:hypothetical protein
MNFNAEDAQALLDNPLLKKWFEDSRENLVNRIEGPNIKKEEQEEAVRLLKTLRSLKANLHGYINSGKIEEFNLNQKKRWF